MEFHSIEDLLDLLEGFSDDWLEQLRIGVAIEQERRQALATTPGLVEKLARQYEQALGENPAVVPFAPVPHSGHGPGVVVTYEGQQWKNTSRAWLSVSPAAYPLGWEQLTGLPEDIPQWSANAVSYKAGDLVSYQGKNFRCLQSHASQSGWTPTGAVSLWTPA